MVGEDGDLSGLRYKARLRYAAAWSSWIGVWGKSIEWFPDTIAVPPGGFGGDRYNCDTVLDDTALRIDHPVLCALWTWST